MKTAAFLALFVTACATDPERFLSAEEDAEYKANCDAVGCVVVPNPIWQKIISVLRGDKRI